MVRGFLYFGLYVLLVLAPLVLARLVDPLSSPRPFSVELGAALGFVAFAVIAIEFALVSRLHAVSGLFGTDALMLFHRHMGLASLAFVAGHLAALWGRGASLSTLHPFSGRAAAQSGAIALWALVLLVVTSVQRRRWKLRYELWQTVHGSLAVAAMVALLVHIDSAGAYGRSAVMRGLVWAYTALFLALLLRYRLVRPMLLWRRPWEVAACRSEGGSTHTLVVRPVGHDGFEFEPGQFAWLVTGRTPFSAAQHPITISSSARRAPDRALEFSIKDLGDWSRSIPRTLAAGARVWVDGPFGAFTLDRAPAQGFVMIAGGVGITPMRSMLLSMRDRGDVRPVLLVYGARNRERAVFVDELEALQRGIDLRAVFVWEEPEADWRGERGFIDAPLLRRHLPRDHSRHQFFVCGPSPMMDALERVLVELGVAPERVHTERFDMI